MKQICMVLFFFSIFLLIGCNEPKVYNVTFEANGGIYVGGGSINQQVAHGESAVEPIFERYGYEFIGWNYNFDMVYRDMTIVPIWNKIIFSGTEIFEIASPGSVEIKTFDKSGKELGTGSGFFRNEKGEIITNYHVIEGAYSAKVKMNNENEFDLISIVGYSIELDIAIIKINYSTTLFLKESTRIQKTGDTVYAIGSSLGLSETFSSGTISNVSREMEGVLYYQITAPISPGNSGGPLINEYGEVIGINTSGIPSGENIGFAIKITEVTKIDCTDPKTLSEVYEENYIPYPFEKMLTETEPNSFISYANNVINGYTYSGEVASKYDNDYFKMDLTSKAVLLVILIPDYEIDINYLILSVRNSQGNLLANGQIYDSESYSVLLIEFSFYSAQLIYISISLSSSYPYTESSPYNVFIYADYE